MPQLSLWQKVSLLVTIPGIAALLYLLFKGDDEEDDAPRIVTARQALIEVKIPNRLVRTIIGRQGASINKIRDETGVRLDFSDDNKGGETGPAAASERTLVIRGSEASAQKAEMMIRQIMQDAPVTEEISVWVPQSAVGRIIGRAGQTIRDMCDISSCRIMVDRGASAPGPVSGKFSKEPKRITLKGTRAQIDHGRRLLEEKLEEERVFRHKMARVPRPSGGGVPRRHGDPNEVLQIIETDPFGGGDAKPATVSYSMWPDTTDYLQVMVSAVVPKGSLWVQVVNENGKELERIVEEMTRLYDSPQLKGEAAPSVVAGDVVAASFEGDELWYRAVVVEDQGDSYSLLFPDYGDGQNASKDRIRALKPEFSRLPFQAIEIQLAGYSLPGGCWEETGVSALQEATHCAMWKPLMARLVAPATGDALPQVHMVDTNDSQDIDIGAALCSKGLLVPQDQTSSSSECVDSLNLDPVVMKPG